MPTSHTPHCNVSFGVLAAKALEARQLDGFWANALGSETKHFTCAALITTEALIARDPDRVAAAVRAIVKVQRALRADPARAAEVGRRRFPPDAAEMIASLVERDLPFYDPVISEEAVATMNRFAQSLGLLAAPVPYEQVVAVRFRDLWRGESG